MPQATRAPLVTTPCSTPAADDGPRYRSGAVARMVRMPVATLRVWERRYQVTTPATSATGQRLYNAADVQRLALLRQLTELGHAVGSLARLDMAQLQAVQATHAQVLSEAKPALHASAGPVRTAPLRVVVVGPALATRLRRPGLVRTLKRPLLLLGPLERLAQAADLGVDAVDLLLIHAPSLHLDDLAALQSTLPAPWAAVPIGVVYGFAAEPVCRQFAAAGLFLLRELQSDAVMGEWLRNLSPASIAPTSCTPLPSLASEPVPARRWDDALLADIAGLSSTIACECPRHVAELLMQLSHFESYSTQCAQRSPADAELHSYLQQTAAAARASFEAALERVALAEGLFLPG